MTIRLIQVTDSHLMADPLAELKKIRTRSRFDLVARTLREELRRADRLVITGDLTHDERVESYQAVRDAFGDWGDRFRAIPGNHDDRALMREVLGLEVEPFTSRLVFVDDLGPWRLIGLDSQVPGELHGELGGTQLEWFKLRLSEAAKRFVVLFVHHPPVPVDSPWLDQISLKDADAFWETCRAQPQVRAIFTGHVHQECTRTRQAIAVHATPSTGVQFAPESEFLTVDRVPPGYRIIELADDGSYCTRVIRVPVAD